jgi:hypothetical protein
VIDLSSLTTLPAVNVLFAETDSGRIIRPGGDGGGGGGGVGYAAVRRSLASLRTAVGGDGLDRKASTKLGKLVKKAEKKLASAAAGANAHKTKREKRGLTQTRAALLGFVKLVQRLQPKHIDDPAVGAALTTTATQAVHDGETLQAASGG